MKSPKSRYDDIKISELSNIYKFILKYIQNLNYIFINFKRARVILFIIKFIFYIAELRIVEYIYNIKRRYFNSIKILKKYVKISSATHYNIVYLYLKISEWYIV